MRATGCVAFFWLIGSEIAEWRSRNLVLSLKLPSSTWVGGGLSTYRRTQRYIMYIPWAGTRTLPHDCTIVSSLLLFYSCVPSLLWLAAVWICSLELQKGLGGWTYLFPTNKKLVGGVGNIRICTLEPHRAPLGFTPEVERCKERSPPLPHQRFWRELGSANSLI